MIGLAGTGDLVATALAPQSRNRRAGELLAQGVPAGEIHERVGQAVEALESVPLLAQALEPRRHRRAGDDRAGRADRRRAPARRLGRGRARDRPAAGALAPARPPGFWRRLRERIRVWWHRLVHPGERAALETPTGGNRDVYESLKRGAANVDRRTQTRRRRRVPQIIVTAIG